ncbi:hypothetical protein 7AX1_75 [uncultured Caudovirales phage]|uniref:Uncharacterized protein n=1 Tax=uncultured Caudovirales phage TaxID=2100421 RepID=A0A2H4J272_9CAUD|nr:hypothetical protein 7AX1_75 [uncultured Caudovirales phage]
MNKTIKTVKLYTSNLETIIVDKFNIDNICLYGIKNNIDNINIEEDEYIEFLTVDDFYIAITQSENIEYDSITQGKTTVYDLLNQDIPITDIGLIYNTGEEKWFYTVNEDAEDTRYQKVNYNEEYNILEIRVRKWK